MPTVVRSRHRSDGEHRTGRRLQAGLFTALLVTTAAAGCAEDVLVEVDLLAGGAPVIGRAEATLVVPDQAVLEIDAVPAASSPAQADAPPGVRLEVWAHRRSGEAVLLQDMEVPNGVEPVDEVVDLSGLAGEPVLLAVVARPAGSLEWRGLRVVGRAASRSASAGGAAGATSAAGPGSPDIVVYLVDALRADAVAAYGGPVPTPAFDTVAERGVRFTSAWTTATWTKPSTASLLTGLYPSTHTAADRDHVLPEQIFTLAERLRLLGYRTAAVVANGNVAPHWGFDQGFESYFMVPNPASTIPGVPAFPRADRLVELALEHWRRPRDGRPLFLYVHTVDPHGPYAPPDWLLDGPRPTIDEPNTEKVLTDLNMRLRTPTPELIETLRSLYLGEVAYADREFGELFRAIRLDAPRRAPLLVLTADHGEARMEHGFASHGLSLYEEEVRIPLMIQGHGLPESRVVAQPVSLIDVAVTLLVAAGDRAADLPGVDLARLARGGDADRSILAELDLDGRQWLALRRGPMKLLQNLNREQVRLFDLDQDPSERNDLADARAPLVASMLGELAELRAQLLALQPAEPSEAIGRPDQAVLDNLRALGYIR